MSEELSKADYAEHLVHEYLRTQREDLRERIVRLYAPMVERLARRYSGLDAHEDLVQAGYLGLLNALSLYEPGKGVRFTTYATHLVVGAIKHHLRDRSKIIREPAWLQEARHRVHRVISQLQQTLGRAPTEEEIAESSGLTLETVQEVIQTEDLFRVTSLAFFPENDEDEGGEDERLSGESRELSAVEERLYLENLFGELRELERKVLYLFHFESLTQVEIADRLNISPNYVSHILRQSLSKLRALISREEARERLLERQTRAVPREVVDPVTGLYSESYLRSRLDEECARAACDGTAVGFIRVAFNNLDAFARFYGDQAVQNFYADAGVYLKNSVRRLDIVGRMGENGFGIILPGTGSVVKEVRARLANRLLTWLTHGSAKRAGVRVEMGEAYYPEGGRNGRRLIESVVMMPLEEEKAA